MCISVDVYIQSYSHTVVISYDHVTGRIKVNKMDVFRICVTGWLPAGGGGGLYCNMICLCLLIVD